MSCSRGQRAVQELLDTQTFVSFESMQICLPQYVVPVYRDVNPHC